MDVNTESTETKAVSGKARLYYLDWLRVIAILMVFLFHSVHVFDYGTWQIKNAQQSEIITVILILLSLWGMPFFFLIAGTASWFALQRRSASQYASERFRRLFIPFIVGCLLFSPIQYYLEWMNRTQLGIVSVSFREFLGQEIPPFNPLLLHFPGFSPMWFGVAGFHLWFVGFLFAFALITLPLFGWIKSEGGKHFISRLARFCEHRGGTLIFILPLLVVQLSLRHFAPLEHDWADFTFLMSFFILGYILYTDDRFAHSVRRDWWLMMALGAAIVLVLLGMYIAGIPVIEWGLNPSYIQFNLITSLTTAIALCFSLVTLYVGMRFLDFTNQWLRYSQEAALPFFVLHQPAIVVIAFFVVQWNASMYIKLPLVVLGSFIAALGVYVLIIRRVRLISLAFGMKSQGSGKVQAVKGQLSQG